METIIRGMELLVPSDGQIPKFGRVDIYDSYFHSEETKEFDATDALFTGCVFDGLWPKTPRGCVGCTNRPDSLDLQLLKTKKGGKVSQARTAYERFKEKRDSEELRIKPMEIDLSQDKKKWSAPLGKVKEDKELREVPSDYELMWLRLRGEIRQLQSEISGTNVILRIMDFIEEVYNVRRNKSE